MSIATDLSLHTDHPTTGLSVAPVLFGYDPVDNMTSRTVAGVSYTLTYDAENRLSSVVGGGSTVTFTYDGDGNRVKKDEDGIVTHYPGRHYESTIGSGSTKYFYADGQLVSFERSPDYGQDYGRRFVFRDHLGSTSVIVNGRGEKLWEDRYLPFGDVRYTYRKEQEPGLDIVLQTQFRYTSQWFEDGLGASAENGLDRGLYFYGARWYDSSLGRFIQPDTIVPEPGNPQSLNRYSYVLNNALRYTDPTGHYLFEDDPNDQFYIPPGRSPVGQAIRMEDDICFGDCTGGPPLVTIAPEARQAAGELLAAIDPRNLPEIRYDGAGNIDIDATMSTLSMFPALQACALTVQGACAVSIQGSGYMPGMGVRSSIDVWVTASGEIVVTGSGGGGAYVSPNVVGGEIGISATVLPNAKIQDLDEWAVQIGGSVVVVGGVGAELVILKAASGATITGVSTSYGTGGGIEGHVSFTNVWHLYQGMYVPR